MEDEIVNKNYPQENKQQSKKWRLNLKEKKWG